MAALLAKTRAGSAAGYGPNGPWLYSWPTDGAAIQVPDYVLAELGSAEGFTVIYEPDDDPEDEGATDEPLPAATDEAAVEPTAEPEPEPELAAEPEPEPAAESKPEPDEPPTEPELSEIAPADPVVEAPKPRGKGK